MSRSYDAVAGREGSVQVGYLSLPFYAYRWSASASMLDFTGSACAGFREIDSGLKSMQCSFAGVWNRSRNLFSAAPTFKVGSRVQSVVVVIAGSVQASCGTAVVSSWDVSSEADGNCEFILTLAAAWKFNDFGGNLA